MKVVFPIPTPYSLLPTPHLQVRRNKSFYLLTKVCNLDASQLIGDRYQALPLIVDKVAGLGLNHAIY